MAAIGITFGEIGIVATKYGGLRALQLPSFKNAYMQHAAPNCTSFPTKDLGHLPGELAGVNNITAASVDEFVAAVTTPRTAEQKITFMIGAVEVYVYAYSGSIQSINCVNVYGSGTRQYDVAWSFPLSRSQVYIASSDAVLMGA